MAKVKITKEQVVLALKVASAGLQAALKNEDFEKLADHWLDIGTNLIKSSKTKVDDAAFLPVLKLIRKRLDIKDFE